MTSRIAYTSINWYKDMDTPKLLEIINRSDIAIYGAGEVGKKFYNALKMNNLHHRVRCFVVSKMEQPGETIYGVPVKTVCELAGENIYICIAVHEVVKAEIEMQLQKLHFENYVWIYPYILDMAFGMPLECHKKVKVRDILKRQFDAGYYAVAIRCLAIENYYKKNDIGFHAYVRMQQLHCQELTAEKRLDRFIQLMDDWDKNGYREECDIMVDETFRLFDGWHRFSLACYHQMDEIYVREFACNDNHHQMIGDKNCVSRRLLIDNFTHTEREAIEEIQDRLAEIYLSE